MFRILLRQFYPTVICSVFIDTTSQNFLSVFIVNHIQTTFFCDAVIIACTATHCTTESDPSVLRTCKHVVRVNAQYIVRADNYVCSVCTYVCFSCGISSTEIRRSSRVLQPCSLFYIYVDTVYRWSVSKQEHVLTFQFREFQRVMDSSCSLIETILDHFIIPLECQVCLIAIGVAGIDFQESCCISTVHLIQVYILQRVACA